MMWKEFEELAGYEVSFDTYEKVIEPMYMATDLSKADFVKVINRKAVELKRERKPMYKKMKVRDMTGCDMTPNGCYYHVEWVDLIDVDIKTGKYIVRALEDKDFETLRNERVAFDSYNAYSYDFDYTECIDSKTKKPVELNFWF